jgi:uncharacterized membrane protein (DUF4010 family)
VISDVGAAIGIFCAALGGAAIGVERQWSGHASGPQARFAGVRTFTLLGGLAGTAGWLWSLGATMLAVVLLAGAAGLVIAAYVAASRTDVDGTTEVAAFIVLAAGVAAGMGRLALASGLIATTSLLLVEKSRLHALVERLDDAELRAGARFAVMAVVILPLLPTGPFGPWGGIRPRELWALVLLFAGLNFAGYVARRVVGDQHGHGVAGTLGGIVSSTGVTLTFARLSHDPSNPAASLAAGVLGACTVLFLRVVVATAILSPALAMALLPYLAAPWLVGMTVSVLGFARVEGRGSSLAPPVNPLQTWAALQMAGLFQLVLFGVHAAQHWLGEIGLLVSGAVLGLTDVDALTLSMARTTATGMPVQDAALAVAIGILSNTLLKLGLTVALGRGRFRRRTAAGLTAIAAASAAAVAVLAASIAHASA